MLDVTNEGDQTFIESFEKYLSTNVSAQLCWLPKICIPLTMLNALLVQY